MTAQRILLGLIGANIQGSLSPALFTDAFAAAGLDGFYHLIDIDQLRERRLPQLLEAIKAVGFAGANITYPFKQAILPLLDAIDPEAAQVGAVNAVAVAPDGRTIGYNFDRPGWRKSFEERFGCGSAQGAIVAQVGAGGAGRAVAFALMDLGVDTLVIHDRDAARAAALTTDLSAHYGPSRCRIADDLAGDIAAADGVVNATQTGMTGFHGSPVPVSALKSTHWAADVIYTPIETAFLKAAVAEGARVLNGSGMCVHAARAAFRLFTGLEPELAGLHRSFAVALAARDAGMVSAT
jgi:shikimate dehydrogenase